MTRRTEAILGYERSEQNRRLSAIGELDLDAEPKQTPSASPLFMMRGPDGNNIAVIQSFDPMPCRR